jgi:hypothetical protein
LEVFIGNNPKLDTLIGLAYPTELVTIKDPVLDEKSEKVLYSIVE